MSNNAAIYLNPEAFDTSTTTLMGRHSAGESFLRGFLRHGQVDRFHFWNMAGKPRDELEAFVQAIEPVRKPASWYGMGDRNGLAGVGVVNFPTPHLAREAWARRALNDRAYGVCGITHTTATDRIMDAIGNLMIAPVQPWDALICTSRAVRASVEVQLEATREDLAQRLGATKLLQPRLETIPLGLNVVDFKPDPAQRKAWREQLGIADDAVAVLYMGRFNPSAKMNPGPMAMALERAAKATGKKICWIVAGWASNDELAKTYHENSAALCPSVQYIPLDGRKPEVRFSIWSAADIFLSLSDNIQETFGLTPVEAMAAGLPCVVSDWDGYRDTVRHGVDGFRVSTYAPRAGSGADLAYRYANQWIGYDAYVAAASQVTVCDIDETARALADLVNNPDLRARMGKAAQERALAVFDWAAVIPQYQALWGELDARRRAEPAPAVQPRNLAPNPWRMDPFTLFANYPSEWLTGNTMLALAPDVTWTDVETMLSSSLARPGSFALASLAEVKLMVEGLSKQRQITVDALLSQMPAGRRVSLERGVLWMAKYGLVNILPRSTAIAT